MTPLPRRIGEAAKVAREVYVFANDVIEALRLMPTIEVKRMASQPALYPIDVELQTAEVDIVVANATVPGDVEATVNVQVPHWYRSDGGIKISNISGLTANVEYDLTLLVIGRRG